MRSILAGPHLVLTVDYRFNLQALVPSGVCKALLDSLFTMYNNRRVSDGEATSVTSVSLASLHFALLAQYPDPLTTLQNVQWLEYVRLHYS